MLSSRLFYTTGRKTGLYGSRLSGFFFASMALANAAGPDRSCRETVWPDNVLRMLAEQAAMFT